MGRRKTRRGFRGFQGFEIEFLNDFTFEVAPLMIAAGMEILAPAVKRELTGAIGRGMHPSRSTGALAANMKVSRAFIKDGGRFFKANIYFDKSQGNKAGWLEYGTYKQTPQSFIRYAVRSAEGRVFKAMEAVLERELAEV